MHTLLQRVWKLLRGSSLQWYILWAFHNKFIVGTRGIIINDKEEVLLLRHSYWIANWGLPGGYAKRRETMEEALQREVREETGYTIEVQDIEHIESGHRTRISIVYSGILIGGSLKLDKHEVLEARFFPLDQLPEDVLLPHKKYIESLE